MNTFEIIRTAILAIGWPFLIAGGIFVLYEQISFNKKFGRSSLSKMMLTLIVAWQTTMYSLGIVATIFMFENAVFSVKVILSIFLIWFFVMVILIIISRHWNTEILKRQDFFDQLTRGINSIANNNFSFRIKIEDGKNEEIRGYAESFNKMAEEISLTQERLKKSNWGHIKELEDKIYNLEITKKNLENKLQEYL